MQKKLQDWGLPLAMVVGAAGHKVFGLLTPVIPYLLFVMMLITYCKISWREMKLKPLHGWLLLIQVGGGLAIYEVVRLVDPLIAQGVFICVLAPTATAAAVIAGMLGGSITTLATYTLASNIAVAVVSPFVFSFIGIHVDIPFRESFLVIARQMGPLLLLPLLGAWLIYKFLPRVHHVLQNRQQISFYLWLAALTTVIGRTVASLTEYEYVHFRSGIVVAAAALAICIAQFAAGRKIGRRYGDPVAGGQGLGQKNTVLAIWMAGIYLDPIAMIGPTAYIIWQNGVNSWQLWRHRTKPRNI